MNNDTAADSVSLYRRATKRAIDVAVGVAPDQLGGPTPCASWSVQDLLDHLTGDLRAFRRTGTARARTHPASDIPGPTNEDSLVLYHDSGEQPSPSSSIVFGGPERSK